VKLESPLKKVLHVDARSKRAFIRRPSSSNRLRSAAEVNIPSLVARSRRLVAPLLGTVASSNFPLASTAGYCSATCVVLERQISVAERTAHLRGGRDRAATGPSLLCSSPPP